MAKSTNDIFRTNHCKTPEWIADLEFFFFKIFAAHCFHEIFRVPIFSMQILFKGSLQSCNKSLINQACSGPYWENIGPSVFLSRTRADILPVRPSRLVNKIYISPRYRRNIGRIKHDIRRLSLVLLLHSTVTRYECISLQFV